MIVNEKKNLRTKMLQKRAQQKAAQKAAFDAAICQKLEKLVAEKNAQTIHVYIPMGAEINIVPFIEKMLAAGKTLVAPKTLPKRQLENRKLTSLNDLETGIMGTQHPAKAEIYTGKLDLIVVPGLAFDDEKYRLGYGGGYYDHFLAAHPEAYKVGIFYPFQKVAKVPREAHDFKLNEIFAE